MSTNIRLRRWMFKGDERNWFRMQGAEMILKMVRALALILITTIPLNAKADVVFASLPVQSFNGGYPFHNYLSMADEFTLAADASIYGVGFYYGSYFAEEFGSTGFFYKVRADDGVYSNYGETVAGPGTVLSSGEAQDLTFTATEYSYSSGSIYLGRFNLEESFEAAGNETYWLELSKPDSRQAIWFVTDTRLSVLR